jgi:hypothetical protein
VPAAARFTPTESDRKKEDIIAVTKFTEKYLAKNRDVKMSRFLFLMRLPNDLFVIFREKSQIKNSIRH